ncbi:hypothetical protein ASE01_20770 [Nocardioides sp. Root190]|uniref:hypothetical protein n=1 Tax=Nocardioides sp. Root190 TaxID=1736488 RepID=UPI0006F80B6A|nr:hypothetical protein [Nocardioides sp. Root190]KRB73195.1 hypothetical protein ASE01_20770 [Nocardioides sp. Root190]
MTRTNPIGLIKDVAVETLKVPANMAGAAVGLAKGATHKATGVVTSLLDSHGDGKGSGRESGTAPVRDAVARTTEDVAEQASKVAEKVQASPDEPVNVTEELGLDPSPVAKPKPARKTATRKPVTKIDRDADASAVDATPADLADRAERQD